MTVFSYFFMFFLNDGFGRFLTKSSSRALSGNGKTGTVMALRIGMRIAASILMFLMDPPQKAAKKGKI